MNERLEGVRYQLDVLGWARMLTTDAVYAQCPACDDKHPVPIRDAVSAFGCNTCNTGWTMFADFLSEVQRHPIYLKKVNPFDTDAINRARQRIELNKQTLRNSMPLDNRAFWDSRQQQAQAPTPPIQPPMPANVNVGQPVRSSLQYPHLQQRRGVLMHSGHVQVGGKSIEIDQITFESRIERYTEPFVPTLEKIVQSLEDFHHDHYHKLLDENGLIQFWQVIRRHVEMVEKHFDTYFGHDPSLGQTFKALAAEARDIIKGIVCGADTTYNEHNEAKTDKGAG